MFDACTSQCNVTYFCLFHFLPWRCRENLKIPALWKASNIIHRQSLVALVACHMDDRRRPTSLFANLRPLVSSDWHVGSMWQRMQTAASGKQLRGPWAAWAKKVSMEWQIWRQAPRRPFSTNKSILASYLVQSSFVPHCSPTIFEQNMRGDVFKTLWSSLLDLSGLFVGDVGRSASRHWKVLQLQNRFCHVLPDLAFKVK